SQRIASGRGTARERQNATDESIRHSAAMESGPQAGLDAANAVAKARQINSDLRDLQPGGASIAHMSELHNLLDRIGGLLENHSQFVLSQHGNLQQAYDGLNH